jgi:2-keto-4-pentenoate hydratase/2-oxohepta-3-ene-1,7-dioic acid hydratase in catechol pathway
MKSHHRKLMLFLSLVLVAQAALVGQAQSQGEAQSQADVGATETSGQAVTHYVRFQHDKGVSYGILSGQQIEQLEGDLFGEHFKTGNSFPLSSVKLLPPTQPTQVLALAGNYRSHLNADSIPPKFQVVQPFFKSPSCLIGQDDPIVLPANSTDVHFEAELVIVIGKKCRKVTEEEAMDYVFGVTAGNDVSERIWQNDSEKKDIQWWRAKGADTFGPVGPAIVKGIDYGNLRIQTKVNGEILQDDHTSSLIHNIPKTVSYISQYVTLYPGDLIFTGTPGQTSALKPGDVCEVILEGVGTLRNPVQAEDLAAESSREIEDRFQFLDDENQTLDVLLDGRKIVQFVYRPRDASTPDSHYMTFKPFHHIYDPVGGEVLLTSGAHPNTKEFLYPHHRGLFFGFNRISYGKRNADIWHGKDGVYSSCLAIEQTKTTDQYARHQARIGWFGSNGKPFAEELRSVTVYAAANGSMLDWSTELSTDLQLVVLDGDPQHAGFHFRANQEVAMQNRGMTYYIRPDGVGNPGETRNWDSKSPDPQTVDLPWTAISFVVAGQRYTVLRISHPNNPSETRGSERDYGRFGDYFEYELTPSTPLRLTYRIWAQRGEMSVGECERLATEFRNSSNSKD